MANVPLQQVVLEEESKGVKANYSSTLVSLAILYFMMGFITCLNDTLVPYFKEGFTLTYTQSSLVQFYFFLTYGVMSIPAGRIVERVGYKKGMVLGFSIAALGATLFFPAAVMHQYYLFLAALFVVAIGIVLLQVAANPYITVLGPARTASSRFTLIQGVGSIGTTVAPLFGASFILSNLQEAGSSSDAVKYPYLGIAALLLVIAIFVSRLNLPTIKAEAASEALPNEGKGIFAFRNLKLGVWAIFCYVGAEVSIGTFLTNYIADTLTITEGEANNYVAFYWGSMLVGRLLGSLVLKTARPQVVLSASAVTAILLIILSVSSTGNLAVWAMIAVGLCNSIMFAIIFSLSVEGLGKYTTKASGLLSTAIVGGAIVSFSQGYLIDHYTWLISFMLPMGCYLYILFYGVNGYRRQSL
ncbi:sugar MFS transporter [Pontibacter chinhatensis]|uniref:MFS transporter, FHS family, L-fucose permease n=1 Tax=Pontibacter chinhatensis TaxID=1436961 RepID=A0A1I2RSQ5_9BACT|nr:sugar MFS transporter [Pontibacter chinhatensis]SFG40851.1 MFS transporter, FHS family, L-fucose permease [Pontibacter chinhatensis]